MGARAPIVVTSRSDSAAGKLHSMALAVLCSAARRVRRRPPYALNSLNSTTALWPPKPSAFEIAARMRPGTPWFGT